MNSDLEKSLSAAFQKYSELTLLRAAIAAIPYIGGPIDILLSSKASKITQRRLGEFIDFVTAEMAKLDQQTIDREFIESEEFYDLLMKAFDRSIRTRSTEKKRVYARILRAGVESGGADSTTAEDYLDIVAELSEAEIVIARKLYDRMRLNPKWIEGRQYNWASKRGLEDMHNEGVVPRADYDYVLLRLQRVGLLKEQTGAFLNYEGGDYQITDAFEKLMGSVLERSDETG